MKYTILLVLGLIASTYAASCSAGCAACSQGHCAVCYQRQFADMMSCGDKDPSGVNCDLYITGESGCTWCAKGYDLDVFGDKSCSTSSFAGDCQTSLGVQGISLCAICNGGFPDDSYMTCIPFSGSSGPGVNCAWGANGDSGNQCFKCQSGYMSVGGGCVTQTIEGCMIADVTGMMCGICDYQAGYFALTDDGTCTKASGAAGSQEQLVAYIKKVNSDFKKRIVEMGLF
jgi:hypothetical protein